MSDSRKKGTVERVRRLRRARFRIRAKLAGTAERPRLAVHRTRRYIYAQLIDDQAGVTLTQASSLEGEVRGGLEGSTSDCDAAKAVGAKVASRAQDKGIKSVVFDRGGRIFHGRIKALADGARENGLEF